jgi:hypothetical protein
VSSQQANQNSSPEVLMQRPLWLAVSLLSLAATSPALAYFDDALELDGTIGSYLEIPHHPSLNPSNALTLEAWVRVTDTHGCSSILGRGYLLDSYWMGVCGTTLRSYLTGAPADSAFSGGLVPVDTWTHVAVTFDGTTRRHYVNGELTGSDTGVVAPLPPTTDPLRIGSDPDWDFPPTGWIDEVRLWSVARTQVQIQAAMGAPISTPQAGLVAVWNLDGNGDDAIGARDASVLGTVAFSPGLSMDLLGERFRVEMSWQSALDGGHAFPVPLTDNTGTFYFVNPANYEVMLKVINGCSVNNRYWVFVAGLTNVEAELTVTDTETGAVKVYGNPLGTAFAPVQDTQAFATCD